MQVFILFLPTQTTHPPHHALTLFLFCLPTQTIIVLTLLEKYCQASSGIISFIVYQSILSNKGLTHSCRS